MTKSVNDLINHIAALSEDEFQELFKKLDEIEPLLSILSSVSGEDQLATLAKIKTFAERDTKPYSMSDYQYTPSYSRYDLVNCYFTGIGYEWNDKHIALIWDIYPQLDSVMVIPTTSKPRPESKNVIPVGTVPGLRGGKNTTLLVSDMTRVSRKRIEPLDLYEHPKKGLIPVRLATSWGNRILSAIVSTYANESTFEDVLKYKTRVAMVKDLRVLKDKRFYAVRCKYDSDRKVLACSMWNKEEVEEIEMLEPNIQIDLGAKQQLINELLSVNEDVRKQAEARYAKWYPKEQNWK